MLVQATRGSEELPHNKRTSEHVPGSREVLRWCSEPLERLSARWFKRDSVRILVMSSFSCCRCPTTSELLWRRKTFLTLQVKRRRLPTEWRSVRGHRLCQTKCFQQFECVCVCLRWVLGKVVSMLWAGGLGWRFCSWFFSWLPSWLCWPVCWFWDLDSIQVPAGSLWSDVSRCWKSSVSCRQWPWTLPL